MKPEEATAEFVARYDRIWRATRWGASAVAWLATSVVALLVARIGSDGSRALACFMLVVPVSLAAIASWHRRRTDAHRRLFAIAGKRSRREVNALDRAMRTEKRAAQYDESTELAALAVSRAMMRIPAGDILLREATYAMWVRRASIVAVIVTIAGALSSFVFLAEGADILFSRGGLAPVRLPYVRDLEVRARPPAYLREPERTVSGDGVSRHPKGTVVTVRVDMLVPKRSFVLSDGAHEVPLIDDGQENLVAHWTLSEPARLRVRARFGNVAVEDARALELGVIHDESPVVTLEGAPLQLSLADPNVPTALPLRYRAADDHGLRDVELVLRTGARETRRSLSHFELDTRVDSGAYTLRLSEAIVSEATSPVEVRIEARDNDTVSGPKWGKSETIVLVPPKVGESEALRQAALRKARDASVTLLATLLSPPQKSASREELRLWSERWRSNANNLKTVTAEALRFERPNVRLKARLAARISKLLSKVKAPPSPAHPGATDPKRSLLMAEEARTAVEDFALTTDRIAQGLDLASAKSSSKKLATSADELANAFAAMQRDSAEGVTLSSYLTVLREAAPYMLAFGPLGRELGQVIKNDLGRIERESASKRWRVAELSARDLAARLHTADFAMQSSGGGGGKGGGGSGDSADSGSGRDGEDDLDQAFNDAANELRRVARDQKQLADENAGDRGDSSEADDAAKTELKKRAESVRQAAKPLPNVGQGSDSWTSKGASGKEQAERAARALEQGNVLEAIEALRTAESDLEEARRMAKKSPWSREGEGEVTDAARKLGDERGAIEKLQRELQKKGAGSSPERLKEQEKRQRELSRRVGRLMNLGEEMPDEAKDPLGHAQKHGEEATKALGKGDRDKARDSQRSAQRELERALEQLGESSGGSANGNGSSTEGAPLVDVPDGKKHHGPDELRERIQRGLGRPSGPRIRDAVRRYSEGLLR